MLKTQKADLPLYLYKEEDFKIYQLYKESGTLSDVTELSIETTRINTF